MSQVKTKYLADNNVTNAKLAQMSAHTFKGNNSASTANASDLTATQLTAELNTVVGDTGSGGTKGLVPAPAAGDATKFLRGDGTFQSVGAASLTSVTLVDNTTDGTVISTATSSATIYIVRFSIVRGSAVECGILYVTSDGSSNANVSGGGGQLNANSTGVTFSAVVSGSNLILRYTTTSTGSNATFKYMLDSWVA